MPTKHINDQTWSLVEKETVEAVKALNRPITSQEVLNKLILLGLSVVEEKTWPILDALDSQNWE